MRSRQSIKDTALIFEVTNARNGKPFIFNFATLGISNTLAITFQRSFKDQFGHLSPLTIKQSFSGVRTFCRYLCEVHGNGLEQLPLTVLHDFSSWLQASERAKSTVQTVQNIAITLVVYAARAKMSGVPNNTDTNIPTVQREAITSNNTISEQLKSRVLAACYEEIEKIEERLLSGRKELESAKHGHKTELGEVLLSALCASGGKPVTQHDCLSIKGTISRRALSIGVKTINSYLFLNHRFLLPFYLAVLADTGGNPESIHEVNRDCFIPHPTNADLVLFVWQKRRAHAENFAGYSVTKEWSAAGVAKKLQKITENIVDLLPPSQRDYLFVAAGKAGASRGCSQTLHNNLTEFRSQHKLEHFTFKQFRSRAAEEAYERRGYVQDAQRRLNHKSPSTTQQYLASTTIKTQHEKTIGSFAGLLEKTARDFRKSEVGTSNSSTVASTVFGFDCKDPLAGVAKGSTKGRPCDQFFSCSTCPGAIVVLDDLNVIANLVHTAEHLTNERVRAAAEGWTHRFDLLWGPTYRVITEELLPLVTQEIKDLARKVPVLALPRLE